MTTAVTAALFYGSNHALTRRLLHQHGYTTNTLSASERVGCGVRAFGSGLHADQCWAGANYAIDSHPVLVAPTAASTFADSFPCKSTERCGAGK